MKQEWKKFLYFGVTIFVLYLITQYWTSFTGVLGAMLSASKSLIIGAVIAYAVNILMSFYENHYILGKVAALQKGKRMICMIGAFATLIGIVLLLVSIIVPEFVSCIKVMTSGVPGMVRRFNNFVDSNQSLEDVIPTEVMEALNSVDVNSLRERVGEFITSGVTNFASSIINTVTAVFSSVFNSFIAIIFSIYLLAGKEKLASQGERLLKAYLNKKWVNGILYVLSTFNKSFHSFIVGQCTEAVILGALCAIGMAILRLPYATMIGALIGFTALIPVAGAYIGGAVGALMIATVSLPKAAIFVVFLVILQQLEGNIIYPRVVGSSIGLPGLWVLAAVTVGGGISGVVGMLIAVPFTAALYQLLRNDVKRRETF